MKIYLLNTHNNI